MGLPAAMLLATLLPGTHEDSASLSRVTVQGAEVQVGLRIQALSVLEVLPWFDADADGLLLAEELAGREAELGRYVLDHFRLSSAGRALRPAEFPSLAPDPGVPQAGSWVLLRWRCLADESLRELLLEVDLFLETSPGHIEFTEVEWNGTSLALGVLGPGGGVWAFEAPSTLDSLRAPLPGVWALRWPWLLALLGAALCCAGEVVRRGPAWLACAAGAAGALWLGAGGAPPPRRPIELAAILGVAYVGADACLFPRRRGAWVEAVLFGGLLGLAHGFGLAERLEGQVGAGLWMTTELLALAGTAGAVALVASPLLERTRRTGSDGSRRVVAGCVAAFGLLYFAWRAWG